MNSVGKHKFCKGMQLEVVDKTCIAAMRVAQVTDTVDCRLHLHYVGGKITPYIPTTLTIFLHLLSFISMKSWFYVFRIGL